MALQTGETPGRKACAGGDAAPGGTNLTDEDTPFINQANGPNTDAATYRLLGRAFFAQLRFSLR